MKYLILTLTLLGALRAGAQVSFTNNQGGMSFVFYVTNLPAAHQAELEKAYGVRARAVATTNANGTTNRLFLPTYAYITNYVGAGTNGNGEPLFAQVVTTNGVLSRQQFLTLIADPKNSRTLRNMREIIDEWCVNERRRIGDLRNED